MYFKPIKDGDIPASYVSLPEGNQFYNKPLQGHLLANQIQGWHNGM